MMIDNKNGIYTVDAAYVRPNLAAVHLVIENGYAAIVETANAKSLAHVDAALNELGLAAEQVLFIILTHIHLDHAGGAGVYMQRFKNAKLVVHPHGAWHMMDPSMLEQSVTEVYGPEFVAEMYGKLQSITPERMVVAEDGLELDLAGRKLICRHTPGHANHHLAIIDNTAKGVFTGDVFGISYPELVNHHGQRFIFPTTTPVSFNPQLMHQSIDLIVSYQPSGVYLTHFGELKQVPELAQRLHLMVDDFVALSLASRAQPNLVVAIISKLDEYMWNSAQKFGIVLSQEKFQECIGLDNQISAQGLVMWLNSISH